VTFRPFAGTKRSDVKGFDPPRIAYLRTLLGLIALGLALVLAGCGGGSNQTAQSQPELPRAIAQDLASRSDAIADALDAGDTCKAAELADELKDAVDAALSQVPPLFQRELERNATDLQNDVNCPEEHGEEGKGKEKKKGQDKQGESGTLTIGTTTEGTTTGAGG
jgi:hypothetical protein